MKKAMTTPMNLRMFKAIVSKPYFKSIEGDNRFYNLSPGYWVYDELLFTLKRSGWIRFAPGFKSGIYGHPDHKFCIKVLGMGVGEEPRYFCERGYYLAHERAMLEDFRSGGFDFAPEPLPKEESIRFLVNDCGVSREQAELRIANNDILIMEYIPGIPFATSIGRFLNYDINIMAFEKEVLTGMLEALLKLKERLTAANRQELLHNDPMPPNIIFTMGEGGDIRARLVDFELAQNLKKTMPEYVNSSVSELYQERDVPLNPHTRQHKKNLDQHLIDESIDVAKKIVETAPNIKRLTDVMDGISISIPFLGGISINLGSVNKYFHNT